MATSCGVVLFTVLKTEPRYDIRAVSLCKMARAALGLGVWELAEVAQVSADTVVRFERGDELRPRTIAAIRGALEAAGVIFVEENGHGPGVRLREAQ